PSPSACRRIAAWTTSSGPISRTSCRLEAAGRKRGAGNAMKLERRDWVPAAIEDHVAALLDGMNSLGAEGLLDALDNWVEQNRHIHESDCINLNPATNVMNPKAERMLASGLGSRPSLGYPGDKYETGLEAIERIEVLATALACE